MKYSLSTRNIKLSDADLQMLEEKAARIKKILTPPYNIDIKLKQDRHHRSGEVVTCALKIKSGGANYYVKRTANSVQSAFDRTSATMKRRVKRKEAKKKWAKFMRGWKSW